MPHDWGGILSRFVGMIPYKVIGDGWLGQLVSMWWVSCLLQPGGVPTHFRSHFSKFLSALGRVFSKFLSTQDPIFKLQMVLGHNFFTCSLQSHWDEISCLL